MVGERTAPVIIFNGIWFENLDDRTSSVQDVSVRLLAPVASGMRTALWYEAGTRRAISRGCNLPARGRSAEVDVLVHLDTALPTPTGKYSAEVAALGPGGLPGDSASCEGMYEIADS
jgi:predicted outer membrane lipoprotein